MTPLFDSHAHYDHPRFDADRDALLASLPAHGVSRLLNIGSDLSSSVASRELSERFPHIWAAVGIHPHDAAEAPEDYLSALRELSTGEKVVAIGEIGLDYHYDYSPRDVQRRVFSEQLRLARELNLPVVVHSREATQDTLELLSEHRPAGVVHCFTGAREVAAEILALGMYIGYTGAVTFQNAKKVLGAIDETPLDRLLLETDCPYMAPHPYRGQRCDSTMMIRTAEAIAHVKGVSVEEVAGRSFENTCRLFRIPL